MTRPPIVSDDPDLVEAQAKRTFHSRLVYGVGAVSLVVLTVIAWPVWQWLSNAEQVRVDHALTDVTARAALRVDRYLGEHERLVSVLASSPSVVDAARIATERSRREGLPDRPVAEVEARYDERRTLDIDARLRAYLRQLRSAADIAEIILTDAHGFNAVTTGRTSDFAQSDEEWWQHAMRDGGVTADASFDSSARIVSISMTGVVRENADASALGVLKIVFGLRGIDQEFMRLANESSL